MRIRNRTFIPNWQEAERLPDGAVIRTAVGEVAEAGTAPLSGRRMWDKVGSEAGFWSDDLEYPAELIWHPAYAKESRP